MHGNGNVHDDVKSAFDAAGEGGDDSFSSGASPASEILPPVQADAPLGGEGRNERGQFVKKTVAPPQALGDGQAAPAAAPVAAPVAGQPPANGAAGAPAIKLDASKPPSAWTPGMKERWNTLSPEVREEITRREEATAQGVQKLLQQYEPADRLMQEVGKYAPYFQHIQAEPIGYINDVIQAEQNLRLGNPAQKLEMLLNLGDQYGVPLRSAVDQALNGKLKETLAAAHQQHKTPPSLPPEIMRELAEARAFRNNLESSAAASELEAFGATHPHLDAVREPMAKLLESGVVETYEEAYDIAVFRDPALRAQAQAQQNGQRQQTGIQQRQAAAASIVAPGSAPIESGATGNAEDEDVHDTVRRAWNSASGRA